MFTLGSSHRFFLYGGAVDMRKGFDGLSGLVRNSLDRDPLSGEVYIFLNRSCTLVKLLNWEAGALVIYYILQTSCKGYLLAALKASRVLGIYCLQSRVKD